MQSGNSPSGTPGWVAAARPFLLGSILFGYFFSAALFLTSARLMKKDKLRLETVMQSGSLDAVSPDSRAGYSLSMPYMLGANARLGHGGVGYAFVEGYHLQVQKRRWLYARFPMRSS